MVYASGRTTPLRDRALSGERRTRPRTLPSDSPTSNSDGDDSGRKVIHENRTTDPLAFNFDRFASNQR